MIIVQGYLISAGGIISAFIITYLAAKIFSIKTERETRQFQIDQLSKRLTAFRALANIVKKSSKFWVDKLQIDTFKERYDLSYHELDEYVNDMDGWEEVNEFYQEKKLSSARIRLYLALEELTGNYFNYNRLNTIRYSLEDLERYMDPSNHIWYTLQYKLHENVGVFNEKGLSAIYSEELQGLFVAIDKGLKNQAFSFESFSNIAGSIVYEDILPSMFELVEMNTGVPKNLMMTFNNLVLIMISSVIFPLVIGSMSLGDNVSVFSTLSFVLVSSLGLVNFLFDFYYLFKDEIDLNRVT